ncbi:YcxB-like protein [Sinobaca qinghaiensis]|uniref:YcxB-like protein n=1 Tax=Sinobaca qinghaiensis TaxID=342944 RepID=A0A419UWW9_9BACL|nr:YcxB family protein [Sinobaca qinghaiensis]RKD69621.1 YcxB-like protein [Sinobaca qinghaiensis]
MESVTCRGQVSKKEFMMFYLFHVRKRLAFQSFAFLLLLLISFTYLSSSTDIVRNTFPVFSYSIVVALLYSAAQLGLTAFSAHKDYEGDSYIRRDVTHVINEELLIQQSNKGDKLNNWDDVHEVFTRKDKYLIYIGPYRAVILPFRFFASTKDRQALENIMKQRLKKKQLHLKKAP